MATERVPASLSGATSYGHILELIQSTGGLSRQQLLSSTGMSRATLYERLDTLLKRGFVYEAESLHATGGRRSRKIRFDDRGRVILALILGQTHATVSVTGLDGRPLRSRTLAHEIRDPADAVLAPLIRTGRDLLAENKAESLTGIGVSLPSPVDPETGHVAHATTLPGWPIDAVTAAVSREWTEPVVVENDARAAALGERNTDEETLVYVKVASGIGCGTVVDGAILRGAHGAAGDIGHIRVATDGPVCSCGRRGCLATFSSGRALLDQLAGSGLTTLEAISTAAKRDDSRVVAALDDAADVLGQALAATVATVNPARLVLGGTIGMLPSFVNRVRDRVLSDVVARIAEGLAIEAGAPGDEAAARGLATLVMRKAFSPISVDSLITEHLGAASRRSADDDRSLSRAAAPATTAQ
ncbi:MAG TPA: ROK family transcriptional regulator [Glaciibacter sp.]|nr:ROK family transcriptional regulator [Glaciibacter sp.]